MNAKQTLAQWLADGELERALAGLSIAAEHPSLPAGSALPQNLIFQKSRYNTLKISHAKGTLTHADHSVELARIREAVHELIAALPDALGAEGLEQVPRTPRLDAQPPRRRKSGAFWATLLTALGVLLALLAYLNDVGIFPKKSDSAPAVQPAIAPPQADTVLQQITHGDQSHNIKTESGNVIINQPDTDWEKAAKKPQKQRDSTRQQ